MGGLEPTQAATGTRVFLAGVAVRVVAVRALGWFYPCRVRVTADQPLVNGGPYTNLRHSALVGLLLAQLGMALLLRIRGEEKVLLNRIRGESDFCRARRWLVPFVW